MGLYLLLLHWTPPPKALSISTRCLIFAEKAAQNSVWGTSPGQKMWGGNGERWAESGKFASFSVFLQTGESSFESNRPLSSIPHSTQKLAGFASISGTTASKSGVKMSTTPVHPVATPPLWIMTPGGGLSCKREKLSTINTEGVSRSHCSRVSYTVHVKHKIHKLSLNCVYNLQVTFKLCIKNNSLNLSVCPYTTVCCRRLSD